MGVSGSGKSTLGSLLARALDCPFLEGDDFHSVEAIAKMRAGHPLSDVDRWPWLDRLGEAVGTAARTHGRAVATCSALKRRYRDRLIAATAGSVRFVLLDTDRDELVERLQHRAHHYMPASLLDSQLDSLELPAPDEPVLALDAHHSPSELCYAAITWAQGT
ncbi:gluconokinase [Sphingomonas sp. Mn802worker]|uniref:gluconokinase n=1 Tax=Sphingomonas sp. Mn802worker TaxID=629773 RepID=UPI0003613177|nr:gluconokinase [Sphingomonas sp. Mn802worker]